jgi:hypothetical protein
VLVLELEEEFFFCYSGSRIVNAVGKHDGAVKSRLIVRGRDTRNRVVYRVVYLASVMVEFDFADCGGEVVTVRGKVNERNHPVAESNNPEFFVGGFAFY